MCTHIPQDPILMANIPPPLEYSHDSRHSEIQMDKGMSCDAITPTTPTTDANMGNNLQTESMAVGTSNMSEFCTNHEGDVNGEQVVEATNLSWIWVA